MEGVADLFARDGDANEGLSVADRLKVYLAKMLKEAIRCDWLAYELAETKCTVGLEQDAPGLGSFIHPPDGRLVITGLKTGVSVTRVWSRPALTQKPCDALGVLGTRTRRHGGQEVGMKANGRFLSSLTSHTASAASQWLGTVFQNHQEGEWLAAPAGG
jgi:hypothetical protein